MAVDPSFLCLKSTMAPPFTKAEYKTVYQTIEFISQLVSHLPISIFELLDLIPTAKVKGVSEK